MRRRVRHIHFVGVGGIGMSALAELLHDQGYRVSGSDVVAGATTERLLSLGVPVAIGHDAGHVGDADVLVYSSAVRADNPERARAERDGITVVSRGEMLAEMMRGQDGIAIAGSHGKTTTTSLVAHVLEAAGLDPTAVIGGRALGADGERRGVRHGKSALFVAETDESDGSFLHLAPVIAVVTNVDPEHLDHYGSFDALEDAFARFADSVPFWGLALLCADNPGVQRLLPRLSRRHATYGLGEDAALRATGLEPGPDGMRFQVERSGRRLGTVSLPLAGAHNAANALAAIGVALELEVPFETIADALARFPGVERRFERRGEALLQLVAVHLVRHLLRREACGVHVLLGVQHRHLARRRRRRRVERLAVDQLVDLARDVVLDRALAVELD